MAYGRGILTLICLIVLAGMFLPDDIQAQAFNIYDTSWARQYTGPGNLNDVARWIDLDGNGNVYIGGQSNSDSTGFDYVIVKYDSNGNEIWVRRYNGPGNGTDSAMAFWLDAAASIYVTGASIGAGTGFDYATLKYDSDGILLWERRYSLTAQSDMAKDLAVDDAGNVFVTGHSRGIGTGQDYLTIKYDAAGTALWERRYNSSGVEQDTARHVVVDDSGNVYITGTSPNPGELADIVTVKYDAAGSFKWVQRYNGTGDGFDAPNDATVSADGNLCVTGSVWSNTRDDFITLMYASDGSLLWDESYNGTGGWYDAARVVRADAAGNVFVTGGSDSPEPFVDDIVTIKYDAAGTALWTQRYSGPIAGDDAIPYGAQVLADGSIWVGGYSDSVLIDFTALHYTADGDLEQVRRFFVDEYTEDPGFDIAIDDDGFIYMTGATRPAGSRTDFSTVKFKPCSCPFQVDADEDGFLTANDLNGLINVTFFAQANLSDQGCPLERFDFDCSGFVDAVDVNEMIDHLFFNGPGPCQPCDDL